jgi:small subunit ribosomal protein S13
MGGRKGKKIKAEEEVKEEKKPAKPVKPVKKVSEEQLIRVAGSNIDGRKPIGQALLRIKGISHVMSNAICTVSGFDPKISIGSLKEDEVKRLEEVIATPMKFGVPIWMVNRKKDIETGKDFHISGPDLEISRKFDIQRKVDIKSYQGARHMFGLPVRAQRTRSSFRRGKVVGVVRKTVLLAQKKGKEEEGKKEEKK